MHEADATLDGFLGGRLLVRQPRHGFRSGTEALLLAGAVPARAGESALDYRIRRQYRDVAATGSLWATPSPAR